MISGLQKVYEERNSSFFLHGLPFHQYLHNCSSLAKTNGLTSARHYVLSYRCYQILPICALVFNSSGVFVWCLGTVRTCMCACVHASVFVCVCVGGCVYPCRRTWRPEVGIILSFFYSSSFQFLRQSLFEHRLLKFIQSCWPVSPLDHSVFAACPQHYLLDG